MTRPPDHPHRGRTAAMLLVQSARAVLRRPGRSLATAVGVALGVTVLIVTVGLSTSAQAQINATFDELRATLVRVSDNDDQAGTGLFDEFGSGPPFDQQIGQLSGVVTGGELWGVGTAPVVANPGSGALSLDLLAASPGAMHAAGAELGWGRFYDDTEADSLVVMLGPQAAHALDITWLPGASERTITVDGRPALLAGVLADAGAAPELSSAVLVSPRSARQIGTDTTVGQGALVRTELGAVQSVVRHLPNLVEPTDPNRVGVLVPPEPEQLRTSVQGSVDSLALAVAAFSVVVGALGITSSMLTAVGQRAGEIGLRRALGGSAGWVLAQFLAEGAGLGLLGGLLGTVCGVLALAIAAIANGLVPVIAMSAVLAMPAAGAVIGMLASIYPAVRAAATTPAQSLRR